MNVDTPTQETSTKSRDSNITAPTKIFSPLQIAAGLALGSFPAISYFFYQNYRAIGDEKNAKKSIWAGIAGCIVYFAIVIITNLNLSSSATAGLASAGYIISNNTFMTKNDIKASPSHDFHSNWRVVIVALGLLTLYMMITFVIIITLTTLAQTYGWDRVLAHLSADAEPLL